MHNLTTLRIAANLFSGAGFAVIAMVCFWWLLHWRAIGHRFLLILGCTVCTLHAFTNSFAAWDIYRGGVSLGTLNHLLGAILLLLFALHLTLSADDGLITLRTSEAEDRLRKDHAADQEQARLQLEYLAIQTLQKSQALVVAREAGARELKHHG